jgi:hypothetical protein
MITLLRSAAQPRVLLVWCLVAASTPLLPAQGWYRDAFLAPVTATTFATEAPKGVVRIGPVVVDVFAQARTGHSTNVLLEPVAQAGWQASYGAGFDATWQAARDQQLKLTGELVQRHTLSGPGVDRTYLVLEPGSALRYTAYINAIRFTPFLNLSRQIDPIAAPTVTNTATFEQNTYDFGLQADWPLHLTTLQVMALAGRKTTESDIQPQATTDRELISGRLLRAFSAALDLGVDAYVITQDYENGPARASEQQSASVFSRWALSSTTQLKLALGLNRYDFNTPVLEDDAAGANALFGELQFAHRVRPKLQYRLRLAQTQSDGVTSNYYETREASLSPSLTLNERTNLQLEAGWLKVTESLATGERGTRYNLGAGLEIVLPASFRLRADFRSLRKFSNLPSRTYRQRTWDLELRKQF